MFVAVTGDKSHDFIECHGKDGQRCLDVLRHLLRTTAAADVGGCCLVGHRQPHRDECACVQSTGFERVNKRTLRRWCNHCCRRSQSLGEFGLTAGSSWVRHMLFRPGCGPCHSVVVWVQHTRHCPHVRLNVEVYRRWSDCGSNTEVSCTPCSGGISDGGISLEPFPTICHRQHHAHE